MNLEEMVLKLDEKITELTKMSGVDRTVEHLLDDKINEVLKSVNNTENIR